MHGPIFNEVIVVEDQRDLVVDGGQLVEQGGQDHLSRVGAHLDELERTRRDPRAGLVQRRDRAGPKSRRIIVGSIKGQPAAPTAVIGAAHPLRQKRCLAPARRRTEQRELARGFRRKDLDQSRPFDELSADGRWRRLGGEQHRRLASVRVCFALELEEGRRDAQQIVDLSAADDDHALNANRGIAWIVGHLGATRLGQLTQYFRAAVGSGHPTLLTMRSARALQTRSLSRSACCGLRDGDTDQGPPRRAVATRVDDTARSRRPRQVQASPADPRAFRRRWSSVMTARQRRRVARGGAGTGRALCECVCHRNRTR